MTQELGATMGSLLREFRRKKGLGIKAAAPMASISPGYLSKIENDQKKPSQGLLKKLSEIYSIDIENKQTLLKLLDQASTTTGNVPDDIKKIIQTHGDDVFELIRKTYRNRKDSHDNE